MEFKYTIDPNADEPIMLIDKHIGYDSEDGYGVMGAEFSRELLVLDGMGKSRINIWINSAGGSVSDAEQIISTILKSKTKVDTHNLGLCASSAGSIFLAGRDRYMMDYAKFMMHPVSGGDAKMRQAFSDSVVTMLTSRFSIYNTEKAPTYEDIKSMMSVTTWLNAEQCEDMGMCKRDESSRFNRKPRKPLDVNNIAEAYLESKLVVNSILSEIKQSQKKQMNKVTNKLNLNVDASEDSIISAIQSIENRAKVAEEALNTVNGEKSALQAKLADLEAYKNKVESEAKAKAEAEAEAQRTALVAKAKETVANYVKAGKIENKAEVIEVAEKLAESNLDGYVKMMDSMPVNKVSPKPIVDKSGDDKTVVPYNAANVMAQIAIKNNQVK